MSARFSLKITTRYHSVRSRASPDWRSFQRSLVATARCTIFWLFWVWRTSGSRPRWPTRITLLTLPAIAPARLLLTRDHGARISGMDALAPIPHSGSRDADGLRAAELEHAVQGMDGHGDLGGLMTVRARAERVSNHPLVAGDCYLGQSATILS